MVTKPSRWTCLPNLPSSPRIYRILHSEKLIFTNLPAELPEIILWNLITGIGHHIPNHLSLCSCTFRRHFINFKPPMYVNNVYEQAFFPVYSLIFTTIPKYKVLNLLNFIQWGIIIESTWKNSNCPSLQYVLSNYEMPGELHQYYSTTWRELYGEQYSQPT